MEKIVERNQKTGEEKFNKLIEFETMVKDIKMIKKGKKNLNVIIKGVKNGKFMDDFGTIIDYMS